MSDAADARIRSLPLWEGEIAWEPLTGGLSNESFLVRDRGGRYVVRFGRDFPFHHVSRAREVMVARAAHAAGLAPELVYDAPGVMVSRYVEGITYGPEEVQANIPRVAEIVRAFHRRMPQEVSGPGYLFWVFHVVRDYARTLSAGESRLAGRLPEFLALNAEFEAAQVPLPIVFGHQDLLPANFLDDGRRLWLIDFEYAGFSTALFDLAGVASHGLFDGRQSEELLTLYFGEPPGPALRQAQAAMQCAALLREALWSLVSELYLDIPGVDYVAYTQQNLDLLAAALERYRRLYGKAP